jgi:hypothetical protein
MRLLFIMQANDAIILHAGNRQNLQPPPQACVVPAGTR